MNLNCIRFEKNIAPYVEVENRSLVSVTFWVQYTTPGGSVITRNSSVLNFQQMQKISFPLNSLQVIVRIYNVSVHPNVILKEGYLVMNRPTCFEVNGTQATARVREVQC